VHLDGVASGRRQDQALQATCHPAVAIAERVDHDEVQMDHGRPDDGQSGCFVHAFHQHRHEFRHLVEIRTLVDDLAGGFPLHEDAAGSPSTWTRAEVVVRHHEVQALDEVQ